MCAIFPLICAEPCKKTMRNRSYGRRKSDNYRNAMTGLPQSVRDRLAAQQQAASSHPDADMLNAFVEDALTAGERNTVLEHLARCPTCREVVAISGTLPQETAEAQSPVAPVAWRWNWAVLRWAAPLAAVVV